MSLSSAIGPNLGPRLHGYPLQFQQTNLKETWVRFDCYLYACFRLFAFYRAKQFFSVILRHNIGASET
jgi:hypothetical protein